MPIFNYPVVACGKYIAEFLVLYCPHLRIIENFHTLSLVCSAGGMALSSLVPTTVNSLSSLAKSSIASLRIWSLHGLLLTIEAAGLSYVSHVQVCMCLVYHVHLLSIRIFLKFNYLFSFLFPEYDNLCL